MRDVVSDLKERVEDCSIESYSWLNTGEIVAVVLIKECKENRRLQEITVDNIFCHASNRDNLVTSVDGQIQIQNKTS